MELQSITIAVFSLGEELIMIKKVIGLFLTTFLIMTKFNNSWNR
jgi:hypothetical protein